MSLGYDLFRKQNEKSIDSGSQYAELIISEVRKKIEDPEYFSPYIASHPKSKYGFVLLREKQFDELEYDSMKTTFDLESFNLVSESINDNKYLVVYIDDSYSLRSVSSEKRKKTIVAISFLIIIAVVIVSLFLLNRDPNSPDKLSDKQDAAENIIDSASPPISTNDGNSNLTVDNKIHQINEWAPLNYDGRTLAEVRITKVTNNVSDFPDYIQSAEKSNIKRIVRLNIEYKNISVDKGYSPNRYDDIAFFKDNKMLSFSSSWDGGEKDVSKGRTGVMKPSYKFDTDISQFNSLEIDFDYSFLVLSEFGTNDTNSIIHFKVNLEH
ncbi:hypothetical protein [Enterococcus faecium]|uniref:hypothetical protein n=1 Tax=Enterococcus faecium TaxID=1352 RepID=UPI00226DCDB9|nr:hypothetical protein [Enterococcus faecium]